MVFQQNLLLNQASELNIIVDEEGFKDKFKRTSRKSRAGASIKFKCGLASTGDIEIKYHTTTHLLEVKLKASSWKRCSSNGF